ncbi:MAG: nucleotide exchange factor GrpE [Pseudomonadota bacterium]
MKHKKHTADEAEKLDEKAVETEEKVPGESPEPDEGAAAPTTEGAPADKYLEELEKEVEDLRKKSEDSCNRLLRMQADFDNYRKRVARERDDMFNNALESIAQQLLPVMDNVERAVDAFKRDQLDEKYISGVEMVMKQLSDVLEKNGIKEIEALDKEFDPNIHHAVMQVPGDDEDENKVKEVFQKGYVLGSKVIRPTLVKVSVKQ